MATKTASMLKMSLDALINMDADVAREVCRRDDEVDACNRQAFEVIEHAISQTPDLAPALLHLLSVSRHLERIADHATNVAEEVIYMIEGEISRHMKSIFKSNENNKTK